MHQRFPVHGPRDDRGGCSPGSFQMLARAGGRWLRARAVYTSAALCWLATDDFASGSMKLSLEAGYVIQIAGASALFTRNPPGMGKWLHFAGG